MASKYIQTSLDQKESNKGKIKTENKAEGNKIEESKFKEPKR